jgi:hypothetical protein
MTPTMKNFTYGRLFFIAGWFGDVSKLDRFREFYAPQVPGVFLRLNAPHSTP